MKGLRYLSALISLSLLLGFMWTAPPQSNSAEKPAEKSGTKNLAQPGPMVIKSKTLELDDRVKTVTFAGNVNAKRDDFIVDCQKMVVYYRGAPEQQKEAEKSKTGEEEEASIDKIVATGKVKITRSEGGVATAEKAVYYQKGEKLVLTGKPVVKQGNDFVEGDRITVFLKEDRSKVEAFEDNRVRAVIFQTREKK
jgi:lipopolysaccharide export system protein LptA